MLRLHPMQIFLRICLFLSFLFQPLAPAHAAELTQRDWMIALVDALGWSYGLPDEPADRDYIDILGGNRVLRFEAEDIYPRGEDSVTEMSFHNFGAFGGRGWLHGGQVATPVRLRVTLPIAGEYQLRARLRRAGHQFAVDGIVKTADAGEQFSTVTVGNFALPAGSQEIVVTLPSGGSIDSIVLTAPGLAPVTPAGGWQPEQTLTWPVIQTTLLQLLQLAELFPAAPPQVFEAEELAQDAVEIVSIPHLGQPSGGKWLRAGPLPGEVRFPVRLAAGGFYDLTLRAMGERLDISIDTGLDLRLAGQPYLDDHTFEGLFLPAGESVITVKLPPGGGIDRIDLAERQIDPALAGRLLGLPPDNAPTAGDLDHLTILLAAFGVER